MTTATQVTTGVVVGTLGLLAIAIVLLTTTGNGSWDNTRRSASTSPPPEVFTGNESSLADLDLGDRCDIEVVDGSTLTANAFEVFAVGSAPILVVNTTHNAAARNGWASSVDSFVAAHGPARVNVGSPFERGAFGGSHDAEVNHRARDGQTTTVQEAVDGAIDRGGTGSLDLGVRLENYIWTDGGELLTAAQQAQWRAHPALRGWEEAEHARCWAETIADGAERERRVDALAKAKNPDTTTAVPVISLGSPGTGIPFHYHLSGVCEVLFGRKRWSFVAPTNVAPGLHRGPPRSHVRWLREVLPKLSGDARPLECMQPAGSIIFIPEGWNHAVVNLGDGTGGSFTLAAIRNAEIDARALNENKSKKTKTKKKGDIAERLAAKAKSKDKDDQIADSDRCASWYMQYARAEAASHKNKIDQALQFNEQALALNPTHAHIYFQRFRLVQQKLLSRGKLGQEENEQLWKMMVDASYAHCLSHEPSGGPAINGRDSKGSALFQACMNHIAGPDCPSHPCVNLLN